MPKINQEEYEVLKGMGSGWEWLARESNGNLYKHSEKPMKLPTRLDETQAWLKMDGSRFLFIKSTDEPHNIQELIEEYESEETEVKKDLEWLKDEILTDMQYLEGNREIQQLDIKYQTLREVAQKINSLDEPEVLSQEWVDERKVPILWTTEEQDAVRVEDLQNLLVPKHPTVEVQELINKYSIDTMSTYDVKVERERFVEDLQNLLVPKQGEITEEQAWDKLSEIYDIPNESYIRETMKVVANNVDGDTSIGELKEKLAKPVIPQFMADFIEVRKDTGAYSLKYILHLLAGRDEMERHTKDYDWIEENEELFTRAWLDGCEVEEEPEYYAKIKGHEILSYSKKGYVNVGSTKKNDGEIVLGSKEMNENFLTTFTMDRWSEYGVTEDNADFEEVTE